MSAEQVEQMLRKTGPLHVHNPEGLRLLSNILGVRSDWHEPDNEGVTARVTGDHLDNAMGPNIERNWGELTVIIERAQEDGGLPQAVAYINLASLLGWVTTQANAQHMVKAMMDA